MSDAGVPKGAPATAAVDALARLRAAGERAVLVTTAGDDQRGPRRPGVVVVGPDGRPRAGSLGHEQLDAAATALGEAALADPSARRRVIDHPAQPDSTVELVAEVYEPEPAVLVLGATEVGRALVRLSRALPERVTLLAPGGAVDVPGGAEVRADDPARVLLAAPPGRHDAVLLCDLGAAWSLESLRVALASDAVYVGAIADDGEARRLRRTLVDAGVDAERLTRLYAPAGLASDAAEPGHVALAALAEAVGARRGSSR